jgi:hypothetical protein
VFKEVAINEAFQIFRAKVGAKPIFTDKSSKIAVLIKLLTIVFAFRSKFYFGFLGAFWEILFLVLFIFSFLPFLGVCWQIRQLKK